MLLLGLLLALGDPSCPGYEKVDPNDGRVFLASPYGGSIYPESELEYPLSIAAPAAVRSTADTPPDSSLLNAMSARPRGEQATALAKDAETHGAAALRTHLPWSADHERRLLVDAYRSTKAPLAQFALAGNLSRMQMASSCPVPLSVDAACVVERETRRPQGRCTSVRDSAPTPVLRDALALQEAEAWRKLALKAWRKLERHSTLPTDFDNLDLHAWLLLDSTSVDYERFLASQLPTGLDFVVEHYKAEVENPAWQREYELQRASADCSNFRFKAGLTAMTPMLFDLTEPHMRVWKHGTSASMAAALREARVNLAFTFALTREELSDFAPDERSWSCGCPGSRLEDPFLETHFNALAACMAHGPDIPYAEDIYRQCWALMTQWDADKYPWVSEVLAEYSLSPGFIRHGIERDQIHAP